MGLLLGEHEETLEFNESKKYQRKLKKQAAFQLTQLLKKFKDFTKSEDECLKFGTELECHLLKKEKLNNELLYSVYIDSHTLMEDINKRFSNIEVKEEFSAWMVEFIPRIPFSRFLSLKEVRVHFIELNQISEFYSPRILILNGLSVLPHIGTQNYYIKHSQKSLLDKQSLEINKLIEKKEMEIIHGKTELIKMESNGTHDWTKNEYYQTVQDEYLNFFCSWDQIKPENMIDIDALDIRSESQHLIPMSNRSKMNPYSKSDYFLDSTITEHSRFKTFTQNAPIRHGRKTEIVVPVYQDSKTKIKELKLDHFGFGMCNTALQVTYSCKDLKQARFAYDMLHVISPFMLVFSSTTFALNHNLIDLDNRFNIIEQATEDRKPSEMLSIKKRRYSTINYFVSDSKKRKNQYNDIKATINKRFFKELRKLLKKEKCELYKDKILMVHFSSLFIRDFLIVFKNRLNNKLPNDTLDFEAIQSSNWNDMRLKPPSSLNSNLGWLVEFRCMDSPITEIEKSLLTFLTTLFFRIVVDGKMDVNFYLPISLVDVNFQRAYQRDSLKNQKFYFRKHFCPRIPSFEESEEIVEITMTDFWVGCDEFAGMRTLFQTFLALNESILEAEKKKTNEDVQAAVEMMFEFFKERANGNLMNTSRYFRNLVINHPSYKQDSSISDSITTNILDQALNLMKTNYEKSMFGNFKF